jgi:D-alanyl-D-alanine carboxypeptidase
MTCYTVIFLFKKSLKKKACRLINELNIEPKELILSVSRKAALNLGTTANLRIGDELSLMDLLYGMMLPSGNDAAFAVAEGLGR